MKKLLTWLLVGLVLAVFAAEAFASFTVTKKVSTPMGVKKMVTARLTFDSAYATGGESLTPAELGMSTIEWAMVVPDTVTAASYNFGYDIWNEKVFCGSFEDTVAVAIDPAAINIIATLDHPSFDIIDPNDDAGADTIAVDIDAISDTIAVDISSTSGNFVATFEEPDAGELNGMKVRIMAFGR